MEDNEINLDARTITKGVISFAASYCASNVVKQVIKNNVEVPETRRAAVILWVGTGVISGVASYYVARNVERQFDEVLAAVDKATAKVNDPDI